jgi:ubiquinone/menaquinone biosynthesis C-methylase UbiE
VSFDRVADVYDRTRRLPDEVMSRLVKTLTTEFEGCTRILDVGVGTGRLAEPLQNAGLRVVGVDISRKMINRAKEKGVECLVLTDARLIPFRDKVFDAAVSVHLLHLVSDWRKVIGEICRVTRRALCSLYLACEDPVRNAYRQLLKEHGLERRHAGKSEQDLRGLVVPSKSLFVTSYDTFADDTLANLMERNRSSQWDVPEDVNLEVVKRLKTTYAGKMFKQELYVSIWDVNSLKTLAET